MKRPLSGLTDQPIDESRQFVREALRLAEEKAALAARDRVQEQGGSAFESIDAIRGAIIEARRAYFAQRQHLYEQGNAEAESRALPEADARAVLDDVTLGRRYRDMIQSIATSSTLRGAEVTATLALEERLETIHREAWRKSGSPENGERAIGEHIRAGSDFAAQALPPRAARALNALRQEAGLSPIGIEADQAVDDQDLRQVPESLAPSDQADAPPMSDIAGPSESETANTPSALQEQNHSEGRAAANDATAPLVSPAPASNEPDAKNPANDAAPPVLDTVSEADLNRVRKVREADRVAAQTLLRERGQALPRPEDASPEVGVPHDERGTDIEDNQIDIDAALRKPITTSDGYTVPAHIASRYMIKEGRYWRLDSMQPGAQPTPATKPHFEDVGKRLITQQNDRGTIADMLAVMKAKNIDAITVKGSETFRRNAWLEAALDGGIEVKNFTPKESDLALLEAAKRERDALTIKAGSAPAPVPYRDAAKGDVQRTRAATPSAIDKPVPGVAANPADTLSGVLLAHGAARFQHQPDASYSYFVQYRDATGHEQTVWGVDLKRAMQASEAKPGDTISLKNMGETPVTVQEPVRDAAGRVTGMQDKEVLRNTWEVTRESAPQPATQTPPEKVAPPVQAATPSAIDEPVPGVVAKPADTLSGVLLEHGAARFQHQPDASYSYFVQYRDAAGHEQTVWGVDLKRAMQASEAKPGDTISLKNMGETPVTVQEPVRDAAGRVTGMQDKEVLRNTWEVTREAAPQPATQALPEKVAPPVQAATPSAIDEPVPGVVAKPADTLSGVLLEHGAARFQHQPDASYSYFVQYRDAAGHEQTVWGVDLKRAMQASEAKPGDTISLKNMGETPVTVQEPVRDAAGRVTGMQDKEAFRNTWEVTRESAPQPATQAPPVTVAQIRERLIEAMEGMPLRARNEVLNRFDARMKAGVEVEGMMNQGGLNWEAAVSELDKRHAALRAGWSAPKAAPVAQASPSLQPVSNKPAM